MIDGITWFKQSAFLFQRERNLYIDPLGITDDAPKADAILITHAHFDHFSADDIAKIRQDSTAVYATADVASQLAGPVNVVAPGDAFEVLGWPVDAVPADMKVLDVGPMTVERFLQTCDGAAAVVWNGPLGVYEVPPFDHGTDALAQGLAGSDAQTIIGGGDLVAALQKHHLAERMSFVSTGGGATLEFLEGKVLPGIAVLRDKDHA